MELYFVRHGETDWNALGKMQGRSDIKLNEKGINEAKECYENLKDIHFDKIYVSPLKRAYQTAEIIKGDRNVELVVDERLIEVCFGDLEGKELVELEKSNLKGVLDLFFNDPEKYEPVGEGETLIEACDRTEEFLKDLKAKEKEDSRILIVAHGALIKAMQVRPLKRTMKEFWGGGVQKNCSVTVIEEKNGEYKLLKDAEPLTR